LGLDFLGRGRGEEGNPNFIFIHVEFHHEWICRHAVAISAFSFQFMYTPSWKKEFVTCK
jgi:hypothetical protein